jgi:DNA-binding LacI/PurR family transcriptional regulator
MTGYLLEKGYRRIAFAGAPRRSNERVQERRRGYRDALRQERRRPWSRRWTG